jgi:hypothetical protein
MAVLTPNPPNPFLMPGIKPTVTTVGGTQPLNPDYYATREAADKFATLIGGKVVAIDNTFGGNLTTFNSPLQYHIDVGGGRVLDAGLVSESFQKYGWSQFNPIWVDIGGWSPSRQAAFEKGLPSPAQSVVGQARINAALTTKYETSLKASIPAKAGVPASTTVIPGKNSSPSLATSGEKASPGKINPTVDAHGTGAEVRGGSGTLAAGENLFWHLLSFGESVSTQGDLSGVEPDTTGKASGTGLPVIPNNILSAFLLGVGFWFEHPTSAAQNFGHAAQMLIASGADGSHRAFSAGLVSVPVIISYFLFFRSKS